MPILHAHENLSSIYYFKVGVSNHLAHTSVLPTWGIGARLQRDQWGFDLSANLDSAFLINYAHLKGLIVFYPNPEKKNQLYWGIGPGLGYYLGLGGPYGSVANEHIFLNIEGMCGYEFRHTQHLKTFLQLELSQPSFCFGGQRFHLSNKQGIALTAGIGF